MRTLVLGVVLLAASPAFAEIPAPRGKERECIRDMYQLMQDMKAAKRLCDPKNYVTNPNEYGWTCEGGLVKGYGAKQRRDVLCE